MPTKAVIQTLRCVSIDDSYSTPHLRVCYVKRVMRYIRMSTHRRDDAHLPFSRAAPPDLALAGAFLRRFFTAAGGVYHSLVRRLWCRWFISINYFRKKKSFPEVRFHWCGVLWLVSLF